MFYKTRHLEIPSVATLIFMVIALELVALNSSSPVPVEKNNAEDRKISREIPKGMEAFLKLYGPTFKKMKDAGGLIPDPGNQFSKGFANRGLVDNEIDVNHKRPSKLSKGRKKKHRKTHGRKRKHIGKVPQREKMRFDDPPSGLASDDQKHSTDYEDSLETSKQFFEALLDDHNKNQKRPRELHDESYIKLHYDYKNRKYTITEKDDD